MAMSKRERLEATFCGEAVDPVAVALWRHWPGDDQRPEDLAAAHLAFQQQYDFDFIKVTPASSFCLEDWGVETCYTGGTTRGRGSTYADRCSRPTTGGRCRCWIRSRASWDSSCDA